jgi:hypothetical protein
MSNKINTTNPDNIIYKNGVISLTVLGGVRLDGLDRMRVTLKAQLNDSAKPPVRHNLDLYNDNQLEKFIRKCAEKLELGTSLIEGSLAELVEGMESYRLEKLKEQSLQIDESVRVLSQKEREEAIRNLQSENLMEQTMEDLQASGIVGEKVNSMILYIAMTSRMCEDPVSVVSLAKSGTGKSYLQERVALCMPGEDLKENTQFTDNSFYYYKREEIRGKVFLIEDLDGAQAVLFPIRELQTKKRISKTVTVKDKNGQMRTVSLIVEGPVSVCGCTTREKIYHDNANRSILIYLDGSKEQDGRIMDYQRKLRAGIVNKDAEKQVQVKLQNMQKVLEPVKVINPYAMFIELPREIFVQRRTLPLLLSFIEAITFYNQYRCEKKVDKVSGELFIETTPGHIRWGFTLLKDVLFRKSDELPGACREFYHWLEENAGKLGEDGFRARDVREHSRIHPRTLNRYLMELTEYGLLQITGGNKYREGYRYKLLGRDSGKNLSKSINEQIEKTLERIDSECEKKSKKESETVRQCKTKAEMSDSKAGAQKV